MSKIRLVHLQLLPLMSGVQRVSLEELRRLDRSRFEPFLICQQAGPLSDAAMSEGIQCLFVPDLVREISPSRDWRAFQHLRRLFKEYAFDVVHTHSSKTGILGRLAGRLAGVPVVMHTVHGYAFPAARNALEKGFYLGLEWLGARCCDAMVLLKEEDRTAARRYLWMKEERLHLIPNGIDVTIYCPRAKSERDRIRQQAFGIAGDKWAVGMVGRLWRQKNPECLVAAASRILQVRQDVQFFLIGDGELRDMLEKQIETLGISDHVRLLGWRDDIPELLSGLDIFVLPSRWEGLPLAILEALGSGLPAVVSDIPGNRDAIMAGEDGLLFPGENSDALADCLLSLLSSQGKAAQMGQAGRRRIVSEYRIEVRVDRMVSLYSSLLDKGKSA